MKAHLRGLEADPGTLEVVETHFGGVELTLQYRNVMKVRSVVMKAHLRAVELTSELWSSPRSPVELTLELWSSPWCCGAHLGALWSSPLSCGAHPGAVEASLRDVEAFPAHQRCRDKFRGVDNHFGVMETHPLAIEIKTHPRGI